VGQPRLRPSASTRSRRVTPQSEILYCACTTVNPMDSTSSPSLPSAFDPDLEDVWDERLNPVIIPSSTNSDDFEALHLLHKETIARKTKEGVVIQHRAWPLEEAFRSEGDRISR
jgi:hypothetical protein